MIDGFQRTLDHIRAFAESKAHQGRIFERLMKRYFETDPFYSEQFEKVYLWSEWAAENPSESGTDTGIDLVARCRDGGLCAIQCKCYAPGTRINKPAIDSFIAASERYDYRIIVDTGDEWGPNARNALKALKVETKILRFGDLASRHVDWPDLVGGGEPEDLCFKGGTFKLRSHQKHAFDDVIEGFKKHDRGKLIMACGTGKTFTALRIAEHLAGIGKRVLFLVPSISLFQQSMREWAEQRAVAHRYIGICSDVRSGRNDEDATLAELECPVTTDPEKIAQGLEDAPHDAMTVVFCTYHSLGLIQEVQDGGGGAFAFDLVICDEAHRTTGIERPEDKTSPFVLVHDAQRIRAAKRLYMTATPRLYTPGARAKAASHTIELFSMDDEENYGPEFHRLPFSRAVQQDLLSDYRVVVFTLSEEHVDAALQAHLATDGSEINLTDAAKIIGSWSALQNPESKRPEDGPIQPLRRAIAFTNTILSSQRLERHWNAVVARAVEQLPEEERPEAAFRCETRHVDGKHHALDRKARIEWLKKGTEDSSECRILSNARCLSEGIDVPALDAVLFMEERKSQVDIVQAVGRVMRKAPDKKFGYIVLPVAVPVGADPAAALDDHKSFATVWGVLQALRSHDDRFNAEINHIDLNKKPMDRIIFGGVGDGGEWTHEEPLNLPFPPLDLPLGAIYAKIVERCGDRKYWESWAKDVADIFSRLVVRIEGLLDASGNDTLREWFKAFHEELRVSINDSIDRESAIDMMAQHILTRPVFEALFEDYDFAGRNPVARALDALRRDFGEFGLENEIRELERFYESVRLRAQGLDNSEARQRVLMELYQEFFTTAMEKAAKRLGIVYTPVEIVDFILASADEVLKREFDRTLSDEGVRVLDPFTGTGIFLVRLLQSRLIRDADLTRKFSKELYANEIILLAYYIAAIHIEEAFRGRQEDGSAYEPFGGIVLTDTFNLHTERTDFPKEWLPANSERAERQQQLPIQIIVGNPPWSAGQKSVADNNPNVAYPEIEQRVAETYATRSPATNRNSLYDTYKMAIRWASDRIEEQGIVAFVTNGSWIDGSADAGVRACLAEEFTSIYVLNLRGNARTSGEQRRSESDNVFGHGSRLPVAITILVRNPDTTCEGCRILYHDIGDYLKRKDKLGKLRDWVSIFGIEGWEEITPNQHYDWIGQRNEAFQKFYPVGSKKAKAGESKETIFRLFSNGYKTGRDVYTYNLSRDACATNARAMVGDYQDALRYRKEHPDCALDDVVARHSSHVRWDRELKNNLRRGKLVTYSSDNIWRTQYRPFVKQHCYVDYILVSNKYQMDSAFPSPDSVNRVICVPGMSPTKSFSALVVDTMPDIQLMFNGQYFPRYRFERRDEKQGELLNDAGGFERVDNIIDTALRAFRVQYSDNTITKDEIFDYVYGVFHAPGYRERFGNDLAKMLPRVPFAPDFRAFAEAGRDLAQLHVTYETCEEYPLVIEPTGAEELRPEHYRIGRHKMRFADNEKTRLMVNDHVHITGIPTEAHRYEVNERTPLGWFIERYRVTRDDKSGIVNDPNGWFEDPGEFIAALRRAVYLSVETVRIVESLPDPFDSWDEGET